MKMNVPLSAPDIGPLERQAVMQVLSGSVLSIGPQLEAFERLVAGYVGVKYAVAVNSGTSGLHLVIRSLGIGEGDEVLTTPFSFVASANCMLFERAKPVFVDIDPLTLNIDVSKIEEKITPKTKAILPVHVFGYPADMREILDLAKKYKLYVIEDACEALGSRYHNKMAGSLGDIGVFAFYPNKQITTGEGGMVVTDRSELADLCRSMRNQGREEGNGWLEHCRLGYNYRMDELSASLGVVQMQRIDEILNKRQAAAEKYSTRLKEFAQVELPYVGPEIKMSWFVYVIRVPDRDRVLQYLRARGVGCQTYFQPIHLQPFYTKMFGCQKGNFPVTEKVASSTLALPFASNLTDEQIDYVVETLAEALN
ncbi:Glutamine--scyllo-inositol transaminase [Desulfofarcimen acetoxidans DSM 771]|uniref:Glutamine--scyllo-inositol transaminase n=2 Tax=Desulfofarcimen acetoxidans TaxID=58138 RepID=C8W1Y0_DESAS|nr:Glutamine--scyllo-inositol transaminase [Desulfofarcimen acetoxidans DSM 771]